MTVFPHNSHVILLSASPCHFWPCPCMHSTKNGATGVTVWSLFGLYSVLGHSHSCHLQKINGLEDHRHHI